MQYQPLAIGVNDFKEIITKGYYYVDKTLFIKELLDKKGYLKKVASRKEGKKNYSSMFIPNAALSQIDEKKYQEELRLEFYKQKTAYEICFYRKECVVQRTESFV